MGWGFCGGGLRPPPQNPVSPQCESPSTPGSGISRRPAAGSTSACLVESLAALDPSLDIVLLHPRRRGNLSKVLFEQAVFPRLARQVGARCGPRSLLGPPMVSPIPMVVTIHDIIPLRLRAYRAARWYGSTPPW